jgi:kynurenine formamidase
MRESDHRDELAPIDPWTAPSYRVEGGGKVLGATPGEPNNWGRWGDDDQRGTANLLTAERILTAVGAVRTGRRFSLAMPMGGPAPSRPAMQHFVEISSGDGVLGDYRGTPHYSDDAVMMYLQAYTQLDGLSHVAHDGTMFNGWWAGSVTAGSGARRLGIQHVRDGIVGRGVLLDVARHLGVDRLPDDLEIDSTLLETVAQAQDVAVGPGDILLLRTGVLPSWDGVRGSLGPHAGLSPECVRWLADRDVAMVGADNLGVEAMPAAPRWVRRGDDDGMPPFHVGALRDLGLYLGELFFLEDLAQDCAQDGRYDFLFVAAPLPVVAAVGSPLNPLAIR